MTGSDAPRWDGLDDVRVGLEPWWPLLDPSADPGLADRLDALRARSGYAVAEGAYVAADAAIAASRFTIGTGSYVASGCRIRDDLTIGEHTSLNAGVVTIGLVAIGSDVRIASGVVLVGENHVFDDPDVPIRLQGETSLGVVVEDDVWIGANVTVLDGVTVGAHSVVAAGAVVARSVPPHSVVGGVPAKVLRSRLDPPRARGRAGAHGDALARFDTAVAEQWPAVIDRCRTTLDGAIAWAETPGGDARDLRPRNDAVEVAAMFGGLPPGASSDDLIAAIRATQDPVTGLFPDPRTGPITEPLRFCLDEWEMYGIESCGHALEVLGSGPAHPIHVVEADDPTTLLARLGGLELGLFAWPAGSWIDAYGTAVHLNRAHHGSTATVEVLWGWLQTRQDPASGLWGTHLPFDGHTTWGWLMAVNGFYRLTRGTYALFGVPVPNPEAAIDTVLAHARTWRWFATEERNACNLLDVVHPLWLLGRQTDHRRAEIRDAIAALLPGLLAEWVDGAGFAWDLRHDDPGLRGTEMLLATIHTAAAILDEADGLSFEPKGIHRLTPQNSVTLGPTRP